MSTIDAHGNLHDHLGQFAHQNQPAATFDLSATPTSVQTHPVEAFAADFVVDDRGGLCGHCWGPVKDGTHSGTGSRHCLAADVERAFEEEWAEHAFETQANGIPTSAHAVPVVKRLPGTPQPPATPEDATAWNTANPDARFDIKVWPGHSGSGHFGAIDRRTGAELYAFSGTDESSLTEFVTKVEAEYAERDALGADSQINNITRAADEDPYGAGGAATAEHVVETAIHLHPQTQRFILGDRPEDADRWGFRFGGRAIKKIAAHPDLAPDVRERILKGNDRFGWEGLAERDDLTPAEIRDLCKKGRENAAAIAVRNLDPARVGTDMRATVIKVAKSRTDNPSDRHAHNAARAKIREFLATATPEQIAKADLPKEITDRLDHVEAYGTEWLVAHNID